MAGGHRGGKVVKGGPVGGIAAAAAARGLGVSDAAERAFSGNFADAGSWQPNGGGLRDQLQLRLKDVPPVVTDLRERTGGSDTADPQTMPIRHALEHQLDGCEHVVGEKSNEMARRTEDGCPVAGQFCGAQFHAAHIRKQRGDAVVAL